MQLHRGRLIDHVHLRVADLEASKRFYTAVAEVLGLPGVLHEGPGFFHLDELFVDRADDYITRVHLAFQAPDRATVDAFHRAALALGAGRGVGPVHGRPSFAFKAWMTVDRLSDDGRRGVTMATDFVPISGGCRCDRLRFRITAPPLFTAACHCRGCQRMSASAFSLTVGVSSEAFQVLQGNPVIGGLHGDIRHYFCDWCLSWVFTRPAGMDDFINVRTTLLDDPSPFPPFVETCTSEKLPWVANQAPRSYAQFPAMEELPDLLRDYVVFSGRGGA